MVNVPKITPNTPPTDNRYIGALAGKFILTDRKFVPGNIRAIAARLQSISLHELALETDLSPNAGERISAVFDQIGRIDGVVARILSGGFVVTISADAARQKEIAAKVEWLKKRHNRYVDEQREARRVVMSATECAIHCDGRLLTCQIINVSAYGAGLRTADDRPSVGEQVSIGAIVARVARHFPGGFGLEFLERQEMTDLVEKLTAIE